MAKPKKPGPWHVSEIDFAEGAHCYFCDRKLRKGIAIFVVHANGQREPCGPDCAKKYAEPFEGRPPDFTRGAHEEPSEEDVECSGPRRSAGRPASPASHQRSKEGGNRELEYLRLRVERLMDFQGARTPRLVEIHQRWVEGSLTTQDLRYLTNLMAKMQREQTPWSHENLQACYAYGYWISRLLPHTDKPFPRDLLRDLRQKLFLTPGQVAGLNEWFKIEDMPALDPLTFAQVRRRPAPPPSKN